MSCPWFPDDACHAMEEDLMSMNQLALHVIINTWVSAFTDSLKDSQLAYYTSDRIAVLLGKQ